MPLITQIEAQAAFKAFVTKTAHTSPIRQWFQEPIPERPLVYADDVRASRPPVALTQAAADAATAANPDILIKETLRQMTIVPGTNGMAYALNQIAGDINSDILGEWIHPFDGSGVGYFPRFFRDAAGTDEILTSFGQDGWFFYAVAGLTVYGGTQPIDNWANPGVPFSPVNDIYITCYRYVGQKIEDTPAVGNIATHEFNLFGNALETFDTQLGIHLPVGPLVVIDNCGNVVRHEEAENEDCN